MNLRLRLNELTRKEVLSLAPQATVILPTAATEQHGPHLPLATDCLIGEAVAMGSAELAASSIPVIVAPPLPFGNSQHHLFACAMSLKVDTYLRVLNDLADGLVGAGFRRIFVLNSHGGNDECVRLLAKDLVLRHDVAIAACSYWQVSDKAAREAGADDVGFFPGHAGGNETSLMMAIAPTLVQAEEFPSHSIEPPAVWARGVAQGLIVQKSGEWKRINGYSDAPTLASAEVGSAVLQAVCRAVADAVIAFHRAV